MNLLQFISSLFNARYCARCSQKVRVENGRPWCSFCGEFVTTDGTGRLREEQSKGTVEVTGFPFGTGKAVDLRSAVERSNEKRAQTPLEPEDERIAQELAKLSRELALAEKSGPVDIKPGGKSSDPRCRRMRQIGEFLCSHGGSD